MARVHFYTDPNLLAVQRPADGFGPVAGWESTRYRTANLHTAASDPPACAVADGFVAAHPGEGAGELCLLLKPAETLFHAAKPVALIIYAGIGRNSLIDRDGTHVAADGTNALVSAIWRAHRRQEEDRQLHGDAPLTKPLAAEALGFGIFGDAARTDAPFDGHAGAFSPILVRGGTEIGMFLGSGFSVQFLLASDDPVPDLGTARRVDKMVADSAPLSTLTAAETLAIRARRRSVRQALDGAAFYSAYGKKGVGTGTGPELAGDDLAEQILQKYASRGRWYLTLDEKPGLYTRQPGALGDTIKVQRGTDSHEVPYATHGWPVHIAETAGPTGDVSIGLSSQNSRTLAVALLTGEDLAVGEVVPDPASGRFPALGLALPGGDFSAHHWLTLRERSEWFQAADPVPAPAANYPLHYLNYLFRPFAYRAALGGKGARFFRAGHIIDAPEEHCPPALVATGIAEDETSVLLFAVPEDPADFPPAAREKSLPLIDLAACEGSFLAAMPGRFRGVSVWAGQRTLADGSALEELRVIYRDRQDEGGRRFHVLRFTLAEFTALEQIAATTGFAAREDVSLAFRVLERRRDAAGRSYAVLEPYLAGTVIESGAAVERTVPSAIRLVDYGDPLEMAHVG